MAFLFGSNVVGLASAQGETSRLLARSFERLSSGQRINQASDDPAGIAVATGLRSSVSLYGRALHNVNDGISYASVAEAALGELRNITSRQMELAEQAASGTLTDGQRGAIQAEANALVSEFNRIVAGAEFNGRRVLDIEQNSAALSLQAGDSGSEYLSFLIGDELARAAGTGAFQANGNVSLTGSAMYDVLIKDFNGDGVGDMATVGQGGLLVRLGQGNGTFGAQVSYATEPTASWSMATADINGDSILDIVTAGGTTGGGGQGWATVFIGTGTGTFTNARSYATEGGFSRNVELGDVNGDGILDLVTAGYDLVGETTVRLGAGDGTFGAARSYTQESLTTNVARLADINEDGIVDLVTAGMRNGMGGRMTVRLGTGDGTFGAARSYVMDVYSSYDLTLVDLDGDGHLDAITGGGLSPATVAVRIGNGDGTFKSVAKFITDGTITYEMAMADFNEDGKLDVITCGQTAGAGSVAVLLGNGNGTFGGKVTYSADVSASWGIAAADLDGDDVLDLATVGGNAGSTGRLFKAVTRQVSTVRSVDMSSIESANDALSALRKQFDRVVNEEAVLGAMQSRLSSTVNVISVLRENYQAAYSQVMDVDVAEEVAEMVSRQILQQAQIAVAAQANMQPQVVLSLLGA